MQLLKLKKSLRKQNGVKMNNITNNDTFQNIVSSIGKEISQHNNFNCIYVYGKNGSGKTILLKNLYEELCKKQKAIYLKSFDFMDEFNSSNKEDFIKKYSAYDYLILDSITSFINKNDVTNILNKLKINLISSSQIEQNQFNIVEEIFTKTFLSGLLINLNFELPKTKKKLVLVGRNSEFDILSTKLIPKFKEQNQLVINFVV